MWKNKLCITYKDVWFLFKVPWEWAHLLLWYSFHVCNVLPEGCPAGNLGLWAIGFNHPSFWEGGCVILERWTWYCSEQHLMPSGIFAGNQRRMSGCEGNYDGPALPKEQHTPSSWVTRWRHLQRSQSSWLIEYIPHNTQCQLKKELNAFTRVVHCLCDVCLSMGYCFLCYDWNKTVIRTVWLPGVMDSHVGW